MTDAPEDFVHCGGIHTTVDLVFSIRDRLRILFEASGVTNFAG